MVLNLNLSERVRALLLLLLQKVIQFDYIHRLEQLIQTTQLHNIKVYHRIEISMLCKALVAICLKASLDILLCSPMLRLGVKLHIRRLQSADHRATLIPLHSKERRHRGMLTKASHIDKSSGFNLTIYMSVVLLSGSAGDILLLKSHTIFLR